MTGGKYITLQPEKERETVKKKVQALNHGQLNVK